MRSRNRLAPFKDISKATLAFPKLTELQLNGTLMSWSDAEELVFVIPSLRLVEMGYNRLQRLSSSPALAKSSIHVINLDGNELDDWPHICETFQPYRKYVHVSDIISYMNLLLSLGRLILSSNRIRTIPPVSEASPLLLGIKHLALSFNDLRTWRDIDSLSQWCPTLETLSLRGNHLVEGGNQSDSLRRITQFSDLVDPQMGRYARQLAIAKIPSLRALDAAAVRLFSVEMPCSHGSVHPPHLTRSHQRKGLTVNCSIFLLLVKVNQCLMRKDSVNIPVGTIYARVGIFRQIADSGR
jgi:Leucine-rich repeat (LRR) protein